MSSLSLLIRNIPSWVTIEPNSGSFVHVAATIAIEGKPSQTFDLKIRNSDHGGVSVFEQEGKGKCPAFCLARHVNSDSSFCVFYGSQNKLTEDVDAKTWWSHLAIFLKNQVYAEKFGIWPIGAELSHGEAACEQIEIEKLADPLGWKDEIWQGIFRRKGWIADPLGRVSKNGENLINARSPCPRGCTRKHKQLRQRSCRVSSCNLDCKKQHKTILRTDCPHRRSIERIIIHEHRRRKIEAIVTQNLFKDGHRCCGKMKFCHLRDLQAQLNK